MYSFDDAEPRSTTRRLRALASLAFAGALVASACGSNGDAADTAETADTSAESGDAQTDETTVDDSGDTTSSGSANTAEVVAAADVLISLLSDEQVSSLIFEFGDSSLVDEWSNLPACGDSARPGIAYGDLTEGQLAAALAVSAATLSDEGYEEYMQIIAADDVLGSDTSGPGDSVWNSDCYYLAFYGTPSETEAWAMVYGGHHYARIITYEGDVATVTPAFTGVEPKSFEIDGETIAPLADEVDGIFAFLATLDDDQLATAEIDGAFDDVIMGPGSDTFPDSVGLLGSELTDEQAIVALSAIQTWVGDFDESISNDLMNTIAAELDDTSFSWATSIDGEAEGAYARIDGPSVWIELVNQAGVGTDDIHHHSIYRDKAGDYGDAG